MSEVLKLNAEDGHTVSAYRADPEGTPKGGLVIVQEIFGVNDHIRSVCDGYAKDGYVAIAPALFDRLEPGIELGYQEDDVKKGFGLREKVDSEDALKDLKAGLNEIKDAGPLGVVGYCWGGTLAWLMAGRHDELNASVCYYGGAIAKSKDIEPKCPVMMHFGEKDHAIPMEDVEAVQEAHPDIPIYVYEDAGHGFNCEQRGSYHPESAKVARERTIKFLAEHMK